MCNVQAKRLPALAKKIITRSRTTQSNPEIKSARKKHRHILQGCGPNSICPMLKFYAKSYGTDILAYSTEILAPGSINQSCVAEARGALLIYPVIAWRADLPEGFNQV